MKLSEGLKDFFAGIFAIIIVLGTIAGILYFVLTYFASKAQEEEMRLATEYKLEQENQLLQTFRSYKNVIDSINYYARSLATNEPEGLTNLINGKSLFIELRKGQLDSIDNVDLNIESILCNERSNFSDSVLAYEFRELKNIVFLIKEEESVGVLYEGNPHFYPRNDEEENSAYNERTKTNIVGYKGFYTVIVVPYPELKGAKRKVIKDRGRVSLEVHEKNQFEWKKDNTPIKYVSPRVNYKTIEKVLYEDLHSPLY